MQTRLQDSQSKSKIRISAVSRLQRVLDDVRCELSMLLVAVLKMFRQPRRPEQLRQRPKVAIAGSVDVITALLFPSYLLSCSSSVSIPHICLSQDGSISDGISSVDLLCMSSRSSSTASCSGLSVPVADFLSRLSTS